MIDSVYSIVPSAEDVEDEEDDDEEDSWVVMQLLEGADDDVGTSNLSD